MFFTKLNIVAIILVALFFIFNTPVQAQYYPIGWHQVSSTMPIDSIWIAGNDGHESAKFLRTSYNGAFGDTVTWVLDGLDIPYEGWFQFSVRNSPEFGNNSSSLTVSDGTTYETITEGWLGGGAQWSTSQGHNETTTLSHITSIIIKGFYYTGPGHGITTDWDDFRVKIGGFWQSAYQCGDVGNITGTVWYDSSGNSLREPEDFGLSGRTLYITGTVTDSTVSDSAGYYQFLELPQGSYQVSQSLPSGWVQTKPMSDYYSVEISNDTLLVVADFGSLSSSATFYRVNKGWNLVSLPLEVEDPAVTTLYPTATTSAYGYSGGYYEVDTMVKGPGVWTKFGYDQFISMVGNEVASDTIAVSAGWNLVGGISTPVLVSEITTSDPGLTIGGFWEYNGSYKLTDTVGAGKGYWVNVSQAGSIMMASNPPSGANVFKVRVEHDSEMPPGPPDGDGHPPAGDKEKLPSSFTLEQNYPNPFNPTTEIVYQVSEVGMVYLAVYNVLGQEVATLVSEVQSPGNYRVQWNASEGPSGTYFYRLRVGGNTATHKMILMR